MSANSYITAADGAALKFGYGFKQCFHHESSQPKTLPEYTIVRAYVKQPDYIRLLVLEVLKFLYQFTFASKAQLIRMLELKQVDPAGLDDILSEMLDDRRINSFYLDHLPQDGPAPEDAYTIYCLDFGAVAILSHFYNDCITWFSTDCCRSSELITKYMATTEFYLALSEVQGKALRYFVSIFDVSFGHRDIRFSGAFEVRTGYTGHPFILESIRAYDLPVNWLEKVDRKITPFACQDKHWTKYFAQEPVYLFLVEDEECALEAADLFYRRTEKENFRLITNDQVKGGLANAHFLKYIPASDREQVGTLQHVKAALLSGAAAI